MPPNDDDTWPTRKAAAEGLSAELGFPVSVNTLLGWQRQVGCPLPEGRAPIPRQAMIDWARTQRSPGRKANIATDEDFAVLEKEKLVEEIRRLRGQNQRLYDESINAEDARLGVTRAVEDMRREFLTEFPTALAAAVAGKSIEEAASIVREQLAGALNRFHESAKELSP